MPIITIIIIIIITIIIIIIIIIKEKCGLEPFLVLFMEPIRMEPSKMVFKDLNPKRTLRTSKVP